MALLVAVVILLAILIVLVANDSARKPAGRMH